MGTKIGTFAQRLTESLTKRSSTGQAADVNVEAEMKEVQDRTRKGVKTGVDPREPSRVTDQMLHVTRWIR
jgi:hypothetical protein